MLVLPVIINGFNDEAQRWTDAVDVLIHDLLDDGGLPCIVQSPYFKSAKAIVHLEEPQYAQHQYPHLLVLQTCLS